MPTHWLAARGYVASIQSRAPPSCPRYISARRLELGQGPSVLVPYGNPEGTLAFDGCLVRAIHMHAV